MFDLSNLNKIINDLNNGENVREGNFEALCVRNWLHIKSGENIKSGWVIIVSVLSDSIDDVWSLISTCFLKTKYDVRIATEKLYSRIDNIDDRLSGQSFCFYLGDLSGYDDYSKAIDFVKELDFILNKNNISVGQDVHHARPICDTAHLFYKNDNIKNEYRDFEGYNLSGFSDPFFNLKNFGSNGKLRDLSNEKTISRLNCIYDGWLYKDNVFILENITEQRKHILNIALNICSIKTKSENDFILIPVDEKRMICHRWSVVREIIQAAEIGIVIKNHALSLNKSILFSVRPRKAGNIPPKIEFKNISNEDAVFYKNKLDSFVRNIMIENGTLSGEVHGGISRKALLKFKASLEL